MHLVAEVVQLQYVRQDFCIAQSVIFLLIGKAYITSCAWDIN